MKTKKEKTMTIKWNELQPKKECSNCNINNDYVCFECESIFIEEKYPNYFYSDDCEWELKK
jgi:hypothetical protein